MKTFPMTIYTEMEDMSYTLKMGNWISHLMVQNYSMERLTQTVQSAVKPENEVDAVVYLQPGRMKEYLPIFELSNTRVESCSVSRFINEAKREAEGRFNLFSENNVKNIEDYREKVGPLNRKLYVLTDVDYLLGTCTESDIRLNIISVLKYGRVMGVHFIFVGNDIAKMSEAIGLDAAAQFFKVNMVVNTDRCSDVIMSIG